MGACRSAKTIIHVVCDYHGWYEKIGNSTVRCGVENYARPQGIERADETVENGLVYFHLISRFIYLTLVILISSTQKSC